MDSKEFANRPGARAWRARRQRGKTVEGYGNVNSRPGVKIHYVVSRKLLEAAALDIRYEDGETCEADVLCRWRDTFVSMEGLFEIVNDDGWL
ncbi:MAG: hypothetical protein JW991_02120 [Candidatus Pacebacteria bacterium]|nr:hypothetical protein [Candidatus Paceibacterota bacterium]